MSFIPVSERSDNMHLLSQEEVLFLRWIAEQPELELFLSKGILTSRITDRLQRNQHQLAESFIAYLTPFVLEKFSALQTPITLEKVLVFGSLLWCIDTNGKKIAERRLIQQLETIFQAELSKSLALNEEGLTNFSQRLLQSDIATFCSGLSSNSYSFLLFIFECAQQTIKAPGCSKRLALWIAKRLKEFPFNSIHQNDITELEKTIADETYRPTNTLASRKWRFTINRTFLYLLVGGITLAIVIWYYPNKDYVALLDSPKSSLEGFTKEDLLYIDSILKQDPNVPISDKSITTDPSINYLGNGMVLDLRTQLKNKRMDELVKDMLAESDRIGDSLIKCTGLPFGNANKLVHAGVDALTSKNRGNTNLFNGSSYLVEVYIFENSAKGAIKRLLVPANSQVRFQLEPTEYLCFVPGKAYVAAEPSKDQHVGYTHEFCKIDPNFLNGINRFFTISEASKETSYKLLLIGDPKEYFDVLEFTNSIEEVD